MHELHGDYHGLIEKGVPDPKNHPLERVDPNDWASMIDVWETEDWKIKSNKAKAGQSKMPYDHISGSRSFAASMSIIKSKNDGQGPSFPEFYKETHYQMKRKAWVNDNARDTYEQLVNKSIEQSQPEVTSPMSELDISIDLFGRRLGYLKEYGIYVRRSSSIRSIIESAERDVEVAALKETVASQAEQIAAQAMKTANLEALVHQLLARDQPAVTMVQSTTVDGRDIPHVETGREADREGQHRADQ